MDFHNKHLNSVFIGLIFQGYSKQEALIITNNYIDSCINIQFKIKSKMKNKIIKI